ncbi:unnamed protein product [Mesocestoides corti]|uniref:Uncharacterized protein n=1 Tax=Mesocestoides corti TaxID=53468 RepID=A0A0R3U129_MESCO|nr:unnamed protein product [Mesocestoides corti]
MPSESHTHTHPVNTVFCARAKIPGHLNFPGLQTTEAERRHRLQCFVYAKTEFNRYHLLVAKLPIPRATRCASAFHLPPKVKSALAYIRDTLASAAAAPKEK